MLPRVMQVFVAVALTAFALAPWSAAAGTSPPAPDASPGAQPDPAPAQQSRPSVHHVAPTTPAPSHTGVSRATAHVTVPPATTTTPAAATTSHPRHATHRTAHRTHRRTRASHHSRPTAPAELTRLLAVPDLPVSGAPAAAHDSGADGGAAMLAGMALLLVAAAGGSLLRLTTRPPRGGAA